jgi:hypothetical protein
LRTWRGTRPFWGGLTAVVAAVEIYGVTAVPLSLVVVQGVAGISAIILAMCLAALGLLTWFDPRLRAVTGTLVIVLSLASIVLTNLGGFLVGAMLGLHAGVSMLAWRPGDPPARSRSASLAPPEGSMRGAALVVVAVLGTSGAHGLGPGPVRLDTASPICRLLPLLCPEGSQPSPEPVDPQPIPTNSATSPTSPAAPAPVPEATASRSRPRHRRPPPPPPPKRPPGRRCRPLWRCPPSTSWPPG